MGFGPFGAHKLNPTAALVERLSSSGSDGAEIATAVLPVEFDRCGRLFGELIDRHQPDAAIAFGLAFNSDRILIERVALNLDDGEQVDNAGLTRAGQRIRADGPVGYWSTLPVEAIVAAVAALGIAVAPSRDAGGFVCNHLFYMARDAIERRGLTIPMGLVHVPPLPAQVAGQPGRAGLPLDRLEAAARGVIGAVVRQLPR
jgi:pyroglutamyl-peptidase